MTSTPLPTSSATAERPLSADVHASNSFGAAPAVQSRLSVERCVAELRAGRAVCLRQGADTWLVHAGETSTGVDGQLAALRSLDGTNGSPKLVLPLDRLRHLGAEVTEASSCSLRGLDDDVVRKLVLGRSVETLPDLGAATDVESAALDLMKFAQLLPAAIVLPLTADHAFDWALEASVDAVRHYHHEVASNLSVIARTTVPLLDDAAAEFVVFRGTDGLKDQVAIVVGQPELDATVPIRLHSACLTGDLFGSLKCDCGEQLRRAVRSFADTGGGILLYLDQEGRGIGLGNKIRAYALQADGFDTVDADAVLGYGADERRYEIAAQMVALLGYRSVSLLTNNPRKIAALIAHGVQVADRVALVGTVNPHNERYLKAKVERAGHMGECLEIPDDLTICSAAE